MAAAVRRTPQAYELERKSKRRRVQCAESKLSNSHQVGAKSVSAFAEVNPAAADTLQSTSDSTAARAIRACDELSTKSISEGGLGSYFLSELFRHAGLESKAARPNAPVSFCTIANLPVSQCDNTSACCSVCQKDCSGEVATLPCAHVFHKKCISPWLQLHNSCPCCRTPVESPKVQRHSRTSQNELSLSRIEDGKFRARELILRVSQWDGMTDLTMMALAISAESLIPVSSKFNVPSANLEGRIACAASHHDSHAWPSRILPGTVNSWDQSLSTPNTRWKRVR